MGKIFHYQKLFPQISKPFQDPGSPNKDKYLPLHVTAYTWQKEELHDFLDYPGIITQSVVEYLFLN